MAPQQATTQRMVCGDAVTVMRDAVDPGSIDAVIVDPPYGTTQCPWDVVIPFTDLWSAIAHVLRPGGPVIMTATMPFSALPSQRM